MGICVPKHVVCGTYVPNFTAGSSSCVLQSFNETRGRLSTSGVFFRSIDVGAEANNITVSCQWQLLNGTPEPNPQLIERVQVTVSDGITTELYYADQEQTDTGSGYEWTTNAIPSIQSQINSSALIRMNITDTQLPYPPVPPPTIPLDHLAEFSGSLSGGASGPTSQAGLDAIRTGPAQSLIHIGQSEINSSVGTMSFVNETRYWDGDSWEPFTGDDCEDPNNPPPCP